MFLSIYLSVRLSVLIYNFLKYVFVNRNNLFTVTRSIYIYIYIFQKFSNKNNTTRMQFSFLSTRVKIRFDYEHKSYISGISGSSSEKSSDITMTILAQQELQWIIFFSILWKLTACQLKQDYALTDLGLNIHINNLWITKYSLKRRNAQCVVENWDGLACYLLIWHSTPCEVCLWALEQRKQDWCLSTQQPQKPVLDGGKSLVCLCLCLR